MVTEKRVVAVGHEHRLAVDGRTAERVTDRCRCDSRVKAVTPEPGILRVFICEESGRKVGHEEEVA